MQSNKGLSLSWTQTIRSRLFFDSEFSRLDVPVDGGNFNVGMLLLKSQRRDNPVFGNGVDSNANPLDMGHL